MYRKIIFLILAFVPLASVSFGAVRKFTLVIDAGHGGRDAGAIGACSKEKNINLKVALAFGRYVEQNCPDVRVVYTRKTDIFVPLNERANIANKAKADLFVSVHTNALPQGKIARGFEVYTLGMHRASDNLEVAKRENSVILVENDYKQRYKGFDPNSSESYIMFEFMQDRYMAQSVDLAKMVQQEVCASARRPNKGVHQAGFLVLRATSMPSCLIELGFITTPDEERLLNSETGIDAHAYGIYKAFLKYRKKYDDKIVVPYEPAGDDTVNMPKIVPEKEEGQKQERKTESTKNEETSQDKSVERPEEQKAQASGTANKDAADEAPVFKVQILAGDRVYNVTDRMFKGEKDVAYYRENGMVKYTIGESSDYNEIYRLRKTLLGKFPEAFIIAFKNGNKTDIREAIKEFKLNRNK